MPMYASVITVGILATSQLPETDFGNFERVVSYIGLLIMGWFFWKRETARTDKSIDDLKAENTLLKRDIKELEKDIRALLENRARDNGTRRPPLSVEDEPDT